MNDLFKSKTVWTGVAGVVAAVAGYATGDMTGAAALQTGLTGALGVFLRLAVEKSAAP